MRGGHAPPSRHEPVLPFRFLVEVVEKELAFGRGIVERLFG